MQRDLVQRALEGFRRSGRDVPGRRGRIYVVPDFAWVQDVGGNLMVLADQVCRAVSWAYKNAACFDGDPNRLYIGGQSSGGHLANPVAPLRYVRNDAGFVEIGAMTRWRDLEDSAEIPQISRLIPPPPDAFTGLLDPSERRG